MKILIIKGLKKSFGSISVLKNVDFTVDTGSVVAIIGRSGSGKSTMLRCINGLEAIQGGSIEVDGQKLNQSPRSLRALRRKVGMVFQSYNLFPHLNVSENIALAPRIVKKSSKQEQAELVEEMLDRVGLSDRAYAYPDELSGGQQQRVAIARSLAMKPKIMLFDEVTSALDPELTGEVLKTIARLAKDGMTMVLVTHEMGFARRVATHMVFMHEGRIWEQGSSDEIFNAPKTTELCDFITSDVK